MIKIIKFIGIIALTCFSFYYTEKSMTILKEKDPIMIKIKQIAETKKTIPVNAIINNDFITPGISGMEIDVNKSYNNMKRYGAYSDSKLIYNEIIPVVSLSNNYHKYIISGNKSKNIVSLIFKVDDIKYLDQVIEILDKNSTIGNLFIKSSVFENNASLISNISQKHYVSIIESDLDKISKLKNKYQKLIFNDLNYCLTEEKNPKLLNACAKNKMRTIIPTILTTKNIFSEVKATLNKGSIISFNLTKSTVDELELTIKFIKSKGYYIESLKKLLME